MKARMGDTVKVHFICSLPGGILYETSFGDDPLQFRVGDGQVLQAIERAIIGMEPGETKNFAVSAHEAFGPYRKELVTVVERDQIPGNISIKAGMSLQIQREDGGKDSFTVIDISDSSVTLDANHPLAGKDIFYSVQLSEIAPFIFDSSALDKFICGIRSKGHLLDKIAGSFPDSSHPSILICVSVFNRKKITQLSLLQTMRYKTPHCRLQVYNDHSTEYDNSFLEPYADEVIRLPDKMGIHKLRRHQLRQFLRTNFDLLYFTDNDVIHDPQYIKVMEALYETGQEKLPVCLYNTAFHNFEGNILYKGQGIALKKTAPGVSMLFDRTMAERIMSMWDRAGNAHDIIGWDFRVIAYLGLPWLTSEESYLEHYGAAGIHSPDFETDRAENPTPYLKETRENVLRHLTQVTDSTTNL
jgi:peptidylprolyl isomerase